MQSERQRRSTAFRLGVAVTVVLLFVAGLLVFRFGETFLDEVRAGTLGQKRNSEGRALSEDAIDGGRLLSSNPPRSAEQIVAEKVVQFGKSRRKIVQDISARFGEKIPEEVQKFFDAVEAGDWAETDRLFQSMAKRSGQYDSSEPPDPALNRFWPAVLEAYGVAEQAHLLPAKELLKFGEDVMATLRPGMVYVGGTDAGRFVPTLLAETSSGEHPVVLTQNALCDSRYLDYIQFLYGDRLDLPTQEDSARLFAEFNAEAKKRLEHDEQFPDEPKQIRHRENITRKGDEIEVSGSTAVMDINERLLQMILQRNPELGFALQESFPFKSVYGDATPAGPILELRARNQGEALSAGAAAESVEYWRQTAAQMKPDTDSDESRKNYSHMAVSHGNLLAQQGYAEAAEQTYQLSLQIYPGNIDTVINYREFLIGNGRGSEAEQLLQNFRAGHPDLQKELEKWLPRD
jgi:hypothetical protein